MDKWYFTVIEGGEWILISFGSATMDEIEKALKSTPLDLEVN